MFKGKKECGTGTIERLTKSTSQMQRVPSLEPVASLLPSGENRQNQTSSLCWDNTWVVVHGNWSLQTQQRTYSEWVSRFLTQLGYTVTFTSVQAGKYRTEDEVRIQTIRTLSTIQQQQTMQNTATLKYPGSVAFYDTRPGNEVDLCYKAPEPTRGLSAP